MVALPLLVLVVALVLGVPIAVALAASGMLGIYLVTGDASKVMGILSLAPFSTVADYALTTIPMFILMAFFSASSGLARDLYAAASNWCSHIKGGLAIATVFACGIFGAMSGASTAAASVMSKIAMPEMRRHGYSDELAAGAIGVGATLDILIPPSIAMVIYGIATQTSIGKLLIAGVVPGIIAGILLAVMVYLWVVISPKHAPSTYRVSAQERWASLVRIWPSLLLILLVLVLLYTGVATPTEVGALGALLAGVIGAVFGRLTFAEAIDAVKSTIRTSAMIFLILLGATIFGYYMALSRIPQEVVTPSIAMVIYGIATQTSIGKLLIAGVVPGIIAGILLAVMVYLWVVISPKHAPSTYRVSAQERWASLVRIWPSLLLILLVLVLLYTGVATPTEVGALGALLAGVIGAVFGRLTFAEAIDAVKSTIRTSAMIFLILLGATIFGYYMALSRIPQEVVTAVIAMELNRWVVIIGIVVAYFVISMFMDEIPLLLLTLQLTFPLITSLGFDPIWFGVISMMMVAMGLVFPPVGLVAFIVSATAGVDLMKVYKGTSILMLSIVITTVLLMIFPQIALWLPATMR
ncbi:MAG: hypothetical protein AUI16_00470 [Alphaproteobacteria bacterium 13_2_20CM_2_64_7]|nr:MAG: hypothetical protein AUI16_00470 [Alphaproteobacteria bacterium 13_2_20CM_2_64_7]